MKWLQWAKIDLARGLGGVEVHARSLARELERLGHEVTLSQDPADLYRRDWDVVQTHGSSLPVDFATRVQFIKMTQNDRPVYVQTVHGETLGRMTHCGEWTWLGGYYAASREYIGLSVADVVLADHDQIWMYQLAMKLGKTCQVISNGWDSYDRDRSEPEPLPAAVEDWIAKQGEQSFWIFVGRGNDNVKGVPDLLEALRILGDQKVMAVPGDGFEESSMAFSTGRLDSDQVRSAMLRSKGLILSSHYEGLPLVVLEALSLGIPVVATQVGGLKTLSREIKGLQLVQSKNSSSLAIGLKKISQLETPESSEIRRERGEHNQQYLHDWKKVASLAVGAVEAFLSAGPVQKLKPN